MAGAVTALLMKRRGFQTQIIIMMATGFVLGEGLMALLTAVFAGAGVRPVTCGGCAPGGCGNFCP